MSMPESVSDESEPKPFQERIELPGGLVLRLPVRADAPRILELAELNRSDLKVWFPWAGEMAETADAQQYVEERTEAIESRSLLPYLIEHDGQVCGAISAKFNWPLQSANLGYWLSKESRGHGYAETSLRALSRYCFEGLKLHRLELDIAIDNLSSIAVTEKTGFVREGIRREAWPDDDSYHNMAIYGLLSKELPRHDA